MKYYLGGVFLASMMLSLSGCSSKPGSEVTDEDVKTFHSESMANHILYAADYIGVVSDSPYNNSLNSLLAGGTAASFLPSDFNISSLGAFGLGAVLTSLTAEFPFRDRITYVVFQPTTGFESATSTDFVKKAISDNFAVASPSSTDDERIRGILEKTKMSDLVCEQYSSFPLPNAGEFTHSCSYPSYPWDSMVKVGHTYSGSYFKQLMPNVESRSFVVLTVFGAGIQPLRNNQRVFEFRDRSLVNGVAVVPFIRPNDDGKNIIFINGKAILI